MNEQLIWVGKPSQWTNFTFYFLCVLLTPVFGLGLLLALWKYYDTHCNKFEVTTQRIVEHKGIFSKITEEIELYRVKDLTHHQPFFLRMFNLSSVSLDTTDNSHPYVLIKGIKDGRELKEKLRVAVDERRDIKGVREIDYN